MPLDKRKLIMAKAMGLILSLFNVALSSWHTAVLTMHIPKLPLSPFLFADSSGCQFMVANVMASL